MNSELKKPGFIWTEKNEKNRSAMYSVYKVTVAAYMCSMSYYGWRDQKLNPKNIHGIYYHR